MSKPRGYNQKSTLIPNIDTKLGITGADTKYDLIPGGVIPPINLGNFLTTENGDLLITQAGDYLVWS